MISQLKHKILLVLVLLVAVMPSLAGPVTQELGGGQTIEAYHCFVYHGQWECDDY